MSRAKERARAFVEAEQAFHLGELLTESSHPKTRELSRVMQADIAAGVRLLQSVDEDIPPALERIFAQATFARLVEALGQAMRARRRIYFTGCGATGRLSILLESAWRRFWRRSGPGHPDARCLEELCVSVMAGGDFALIKSVEGFEDFPDFGRHQLRQAGVQPGDVVVAITEGGETPFVIGTAWQALESGATVFFVYNNPTDLLHRHVQRSREVIEEPQIHKLDLTTGPMAITGSTRMQAVTTELLVVGAALEMALGNAGCGAPPAGSSDEYGRRFVTLLRQLSRPEAVDALARAAKFEEEVYRRHGLVTYATDAILLDVLTDTTERSPTFMVPPFRRSGDTISPASWAFVKDLLRATEPAWHHMLQREPRGLTWGADVYRRLNAPAQLQTNPPQLDNAEIYRFRIGNEHDSSRTDAPDSALVFVCVGDEVSSGGRDARARDFAAGFQRLASMTIGRQESSLDADERFHFPYDPPASPLRLWEHLAAKLVLNTLSTATMVRLGRVVGNAMVWVCPSNKKLIDRGCRLIAQATGCRYEHACEVLHETMDEVGLRAKTGEAAPSPVALAIQRIQAAP